MSTCLIRRVDPFEFICCLATETLLDPSFAGLTDGHAFGTREGGLPSKKNMNRVVCVRIRRYFL